ncbi:hypothetical protein CsSME_00018603 [Camellia sinensis var. sinensis]
MDSRRPNPSSLSKQKSDDFAPDDDDDDSVEEEDENYASEFGISSEKGGLKKKNKKKKVKVGFDGGSGKKRGGGGGGLLSSPPRCQAEKCEADLTEAKRYYRRHKVCELHAKATAAIVAGLRQRFCQQCSRCLSMMPFNGERNFSSNPASFMSYLSLMTQREVAEGVWRGIMSDAGRAHRNHPMEEEKGVVAKDWAIKYIIKLGHDLLLVVG